MALSQRVYSIFFQDKYVLFPIAFALAIIILESLLLFLKMPRQTSGGLDIIPLHYNVHFGIDYVGPWFEVFAIPGGGMVILLINAAVVWFVYPQGALLGRLTAFVSLFVQIALAGAAVFILLFNV